MTGLESFRKWSRWLIAAGFIMDAAWYIVWAVVGAALLVIVVAQGEYDRIPSLLARTAGAVGVLGFMTWVFWDARREVRRLRRERMAWSVGGEESAGRPALPPRCQE
jgi:hypothetical protein